MLTVPNKYSELMGVLHSNHCFLAHVEQNEARPGYTVALACPQTNLLTPANGTFMRL
jgi:hypothetical protein